jgi:hypothetical protein
VTRGAAAGRGRAELGLSRDSVWGSGELDKVAGHATRDAERGQQTVRRAIAQRELGLPEVQRPHAQRPDSVVEWLSLCEQTLHHADMAAGHDELQLRAGRLLLHDLQKGRWESPVDAQEIGQLIDDREATVFPSSAVQETEERFDVGQVRPFAITLYDVTTRPPLPADGQDPAPNCRPGG